MNQEDSVSSFVQRLSVGDADASEELFARYAARLARLAERHLTREMAARTDGEDVVQSVFRTFFQRNARGEFRIDTSAHLWRLLATITLCKVRTQARRHTAAVRDVSAEVPDADPALAAALSREPGPEEAALLSEEIETVLRGLPERYAEILNLRLEGYSVAEIGTRLSLSRQTVYRALDLLQERLEAPPSH
ncbi:MAG TPA: sigma-70 family RNA polymerase sigma factor [Gemmataceae bacterium]|nr:sigma-70 family RNA polymerase sigma factor [Gemmataceae bacterium]